MQKLAEGDKKFLLELLKNTSKNDSEIAEKLRISKATASRIRGRLEQSLIREYIPIIDLDKIGLQLFSVITFKWRAFDKEEFTSKVFNDLKNDPHVIFLANGQGNAFATTTVFLGFKDILEYNEYSKQFRRKYDKFIDNFQTMLLPSSEIIKNDYTHVIRHIIGGA